jgi:hypothetical protein
VTILDHFNMFVCNAEMPVNTFARYMVDISTQLPQSPCIQQQSAP